MAAGLLRARLEADGRADEYRVLSAGTWAEPGRPASPYAQRVMAERGIDISDHRTREISAELVDTADLILVMTRAHREALAAEFPEAASRIYLLSEMIGKTYDIADPYSASLTYYGYCADELETIINQGYERILELAQKRQR
jgi:protein-tyrosine-phosphatase